MNNKFSMIRRLIMIMAIAAKGAFQAKGRYKSKFVINTDLEKNQISHHTYGISQNI